jgi:hypothetical protein
MFSGKTRIGGGSTGAANRSLSTAPLRACILAALDDVLDVLLYRALVMGCLRLCDFIKGTEIMIAMPRREHDPGMENSYQNIFRSDERTAALIENHERILISLEKAS